MTTVHTDMTTTTTSVARFIDDCLRPYSAHSNVRGIPYLGDGMKEAQRKAVWGMLARGERAGKDTVERLASGIASITSYHHGVTSMESTLAGLAQDFAGSNNVPLLEKKGQFGDRLNKKPAAARYIKASLAPAFRQILRKEDDLILRQRESEGHLVEPRFFVPAMPLVLLNGAEGMGTGHSTYILCYNPDDVRAAVGKLLDGKRLKRHSLTPWWRGFRGTVTRDQETGQVLIEGAYEVRDGRSPTIRVTELPIGAQSDSYEAHLQKLEDRGLITDYDNLSDENGFDFVIRAPRSTLALPAEELRKLLKLTSRETENLTVWDPEGKLRRYDCVEDMLADWVTWRVARYEDRRLALIAEGEAAAAWADEKQRFIRFYLANVKLFRDTDTPALKERLEAEGFTRVDDLLGLPMRSLTKQRIEELADEVAATRARVEALRGDDAASMAKRELRELKL